MEFTLSELQKVRYLNFNTEILPYQKLFASLASVFVIYYCSTLVSVFKIFSVIARVLFAWTLS